MVGMLTDRRLEVAGGAVENGPELPWIGERTKSEELDIAAVRPPSRIGASLGEGKAGPSARLLRLRLILFDVR